MTEPLPDALARVRDLVLDDQGLVRAGLKAGSNNLSGPDFRTTEIRKHRDAARVMAVRAAREKAELLAKELQLKVGRARTVTEGVREYYGSSSTSNAFAQNSSGGGGEQDDEGMGLPPGQIAVRAVVTVVFDLE